MTRSFSIKTDSTGLWLLFMLFLFPSSLFAQREYAVCDSTFHVLNADSTLIAGRYTIYLETAAGTSPVHDFSLPDPDQYIRDFDIVAPNRWFTLVGSRYIGGPTTLWRSDDRGNSWQVDSSFCAAARNTDPSPNYWNSVNQLQHFGTDTLALFLGYYQSGVAYSIDRGASWTNWMQNLITHYHAIFQCDTTYYLFGLEGDAFRSWAFAFPRYKLFRSDSLVNFQVFGGTGDHPFCSNGDSSCFFVPGSLNRCGQYHYMRDYIDSLCQLTTGIDAVNFSNADGLFVFPNPGNGLFGIRFPGDWVGAANVTINDLSGRTVRSVRLPVSDNTTLDLGSLPAGTYLLRLANNRNFRFGKLLKY